MMILFFSVIIIVKYCDGINKLKFKTSNKSNKIGICKCQMKLFGKFFIIKLFTSVETKFFFVDRNIRFQAMISIIREYINELHI